MDLQAAAKASNAPVLRPAKTPSAPLPSGAPHDVFIPSQSQQGPSQNLTLPVRMQVSLEQSMRQLEALQNLQTEARNLGAACDAQRGGTNNFLRNRFMDSVSGAGSNLDKFCQAVGQAGTGLQQSLRAGEPGKAAAYRGQLEQLVPRGESELTQYTEAKRKVAETTSSVVGTGGTVLASVASGGTLGAAALAAGSGLARITVGKAIMGSDYTLQDAGKEVLGAAADAGGASLGAAVTARLAVPGGVAGAALRGGVEGAISGAVSGGTHQAARRETWHDGLTSGAVRVAQSSARSAAVGAATGAAAGAITTWAGNKVAHGRHSTRQNAELREERARQIPVGGREVGHHRGEDGTVWLDYEGKDGRRWSMATANIDDKPEPFLVVKDEHGLYGARTYKADGVTYHETYDNGTLTSRATSDSLKEKAASVSRTEFTLEGSSGPVKVSLHGAKPQEEQALRSHLESVPAAARIHGKEISVVDQIGHSTSPSGTSVTLGLVGSDQRILLSRASAEPSLATTLFHEMGHNVDRDELGRIGLHSNRWVWKLDGHLTDYAKTDAAEDFAETHAIVLRGWENFSKFGPEEWAGQSQVAKKLEILKLYHHPVPTAAEIRAARLAQRGKS